MNQPLKKNMLQRRSFLFMLLALSASPLGALAANADRTMTVWKDPLCGCCAEWVTHLEKNGFVVKVVDKGNQAIRAQLGVPPKFGSCHTAVIQGYVIEGHVPAADIQRLIKEKPRALGLAVPKMPIGSPGMDGPEYQGRRDPYEVLLIQKDGSATVFSKYAQQEKK
jgi:hypothetical protein